MKWITDDSFFLNPYCSLTTVQFEIQSCQKSGNSEIIFIHSRNLLADQPEKYVRLRSKAHPSKLSFSA